MTPKTNSHSFSSVFDFKLKKNYKVGAQQRQYVVEKLIIEWKYLKYLEMNFFLHKLNCQQFRLLSEIKLKLKEFKKVFESLQIYFDENHARATRMTFSLPLQKLLLNERASRKS